ncbi:mutator family transposase [Mycobacterium tuberculosis]|nr:mutator family transposase [Mycobacterium tuberculosis]
MTSSHLIDAEQLLADQLAQASPDLLRGLLSTFIAALMGAEADALCGAGYRERSDERSNQRNGYRHRDFDTRAATIDVAIPKLRQGSYFPDWLLQRRKRAERALTSVVATCYLLGVSTRRMERLVETLGVTKLSKSQVSIMAKELDEAVEAFRTRPLDAGPYTFLAADALVLKVREAGRVVGVHTLIATGVNAEGYREILGIQVTSAEDGAGWLAFFRDLVARGLSGVALVTSDAHAGLVAAIGATLPAAAWQRCRTHYAANLMAATPKPSWPWVRTLLHSIYDQPDAESVVAQYDRVLDALTDKLPAVAEHLDPPAPTCWRSPPSPRRSGAKSGPTTPRNASTERYDAEPTSWASSPTAPRSSASSEPSSPNNTTNGSKDGATWASRSSPEPEQH